MGLLNFILDVTFTFTSDFPLFCSFVLCSERLTFQSLMPCSSAYSVFQCMYPPLRPVMFLFLRFIKTLFHNCSFSELSLFRDCHISNFVCFLHFSYNVGLFSWSFTGFHTWSFIFVSHEAVFFFKVGIYFTYHNICLFKYIDQWFYYIHKGIQTSLLFNSRTFSSLQRKHITINGHFPFPPALQPLATMKYLLSLWICLLWTFHINRIKQFVTFCVFFHLA